MHTNKKATVLLIELLLKNGICDFIISPGSRNAPIINELQCRDDVNLYSITDERSAGFVAIGMYQKTRKAVALVCTSGSALLNYAPAVSEAFYQEMPLIVISADRPHYWIDQGEGQTIRQRGSLANFVRSEINIGLDEELKDYKALYDELNIALHTSLLKTIGPLHINIEYNEPLYLSSEESIDIPLLKEIDEKEELKVDYDEFRTKISSAKKVMILCGQILPDGELLTILENVNRLDQVIVLTESTTNLYSPSFIPSIDKTLMAIEKDFKHFAPDILISIGNAVISKMIKKHLRENPPKEHWQISSTGIYRDTYQVLSHPVKDELIPFFREMERAENNTSDYATNWKSSYDEVCRRHEQFFSELEFCDLKVFDDIINSIDVGSELQISNSSAIRYHQLLSPKKLNTYCNRGTSGIDGSSSTALGFSLKHNGETWLISGDVSFLYDSNAWWNSYNSNLKIILINNGGGGIFRIIPGPQNIPNFERYFETPHSVDFLHLCKALNIDYAKANNEAEVKEQLAEIKKKKTISLLEIITPKELNALLLHQYFDFLRGDN